MVLVPQSMFAGTRDHGQVHDGTDAGGEHVRGRGRGRPGGQDVVDEEDRLPTEAGRGPRGHDGRSAGGVAARRRRAAVGLRTDGAQARHEREVEPVRHGLREHARVVEPTRPASSPVTGHGDDGGGEHGPPTDDLGEQSPDSREHLGTSRELRARQFARGPREGAFARRG